MGLGKCFLGACLALMMLAPLHAARPAGASYDPGLPWVFVCSFAGAYYFNLETGERRNIPLPDMPEAAIACHAPFRRE
ncbi:hypothetical protein [Emcibacter sp.]|uniref:hypothetical protein n=1 Tax=Emcibacter sp. TaxID=1979954 RepID=UPI002AA7152E|nr:hypothetical protein [Emcibacter sp.]